MKKKKTHTFPFLAAASLNWRGICVKRRFLARWGDAAEELSDTLTAKGLLTDEPCASDRSATDPDGTNWAPLPPSNGSVSQGVWLGRRRHTVLFKALIQIWKPNFSHNCPFQYTSTQTNFILSLVLTDKVALTSELCFVSRQIAVFLWTWLLLAIPVKLLSFFWYAYIFYSGELFDAANLWYINCGFFYCNVTQKNNNLAAFYRNPISCAGEI